MNRWIYVFKSWMNWREALGMSAIESKNNLFQNLLLMASPLIVPAVIFLAIGLLLVVINRKSHFRKSVGYLALCANVLAIILFPLWFVLWMPEIRSNYPHRMYEGAFLLLLIAIIAFLCIVKTKKTINEYVKSEKEAVDAEAINRIRFDGWQMLTIILLLIALIIKAYIIIKGGGNVQLITLFWQFILTREVLWLVAFLFWRNTKRVASIICISLVLVTDIYVCIPAIASISQMFGRMNFLSSEVFNALYACFGIIMIIYIISKRKPLNIIMLIAGIIVSLVFIVLYINRPNKSLYNATYNTLSLLYLVLPLISCNIWFAAGIQRVIEQNGGDKQETVRKNILAGKEVLSPKSSGYSELDEYRRKLYEKKK